MAAKHPHFDQVHAGYVAGRTPADLAREFVLPGGKVDAFQDTIYRWAKQHGWDDEREAARAATAKALPQAVADAKADVAAELARERATQLELARDEQLEDAKLIRGKLRQLFQLALVKDAKALNAASAAARRAQDLEEHAFGVAHERSTPQHQAPPQPNDDDAPAGLIVVPADTPEWRSLIDSDPDRGLEA